jgi:hypothetical protein
MPTVHVVLWWLVRAGFTRAPIRYRTVCWLVTPAFVFLWISLWWFVCYQSTDIFFLWRSDLIHLINLRIGYFSCLLYNFKNILLVLLMFAKKVSAVFKKNIIHQNFHFYNFSESENWKLPVSTFFEKYCLPYSYLLSSTIK